MPKKKPATTQEIQNYLDDFRAGLNAGPAGTPAFILAVHKNQEGRTIQTMFQGEDSAILGMGAILIDPDGGRP